MLNILPSPQVLHVSSGLQGQGGNCYQKKISESFDEERLEMEASLLFGLDVYLIVHMIWEGSW